MTRISVAAGQIWMAAVPYKEDPDEAKYRPVVVVTVSPQGPNEDNVVVLVPITGFHSGGSAKNGDVPVLNYRNIPGLSSGDGAWVRARRLWSADVAALDARRGVIGTMPKDVMDAIYAVIISLF
jgi:mRNA-degrading endonuclease toxin of MazEF toxin-antitoxin module